MNDYAKNYAGLNFASRNLLDSAAGGTFMEITLGEATKLQVGGQAVLGRHGSESTPWFTKRDGMDFKQLGDGPVAHAWERMKLMMCNCSTHGLNLWMITQKILPD